MVWVHSMAGVLSSTSDPLVCYTMEGLRRILAKPVQKKPLLSRDAPGHCKKDNNSLANIWLATVCLLAFAGFLRYDEVANIRPCVLQINSTCVTIRIPKSKTDQLRQGNDVVLLRLNQTLAQLPCWRSTLVEVAYTSLASCIFSVPLLVL